MTYSVIHFPGDEVNPVSTFILYLNFFSESNTISIWNNGKGIPVVEHKDEKMYVPALIFGHLLTSSNYDDEEKKVTGECRQSDITQLLLWMQKSYWKQRCWLFDWFQVEGMAMVLNSAISLAPSSQWKQHVRSTDTVSNRWDNYSSTFHALLPHIHITNVYPVSGFHSNPVACFITLSFLILMAKTSRVGFADFWFIYFNTSTFLKIKRIR